MCSETIRRHVVSTEMGDHQGRPSAPTGSLHKPHMVRYQVTFTTAITVCLFCLFLGLFHCVQLKLSQYDGTPPLTADIQSQSVVLRATYQYWSPTGGRYFPINDDNNDNNMVGE